MHFVMVNLIDLKRILYNGITTKYDYINFWIICELQLLVKPKLCSEIFVWK